MSESVNRRRPASVAPACWALTVLALGASACSSNLATNPQGGGGSSLGNGGGGGSVSGSGASGGPIIEQGVDPGRVEIHRLNNVEYNNTVRDLLATKLAPATTFLAEEGLSFDNTASALGMTATQYEGYFNAARDLVAEPTAAQRYLSCTPVMAADACARQIIETFGFKLYRRPLEVTEVERAMRVYDAEFARSNSGTEAIALSVRAMLSAANFLYRIEADAQPASVTPHAVGPYELASRLSYLGWSSMPDDALFAAAKDNSLLQPAVLEAHVDRLLADPKATSFIESFAGQWLDLRKLRTHSIVPQVFPTYTNSLADAIQVEGYLWFQEFVNQDRPLSDWFTGDFNYVNDELATHYGMTPPGTGANFARVANTTDQRRGFLGLASFLTHTSFPSRTSPTLRGVWVLSELLCSPPPPPPNGVPKLEESATPEEATQPAGAENVKARLARHRAEPACANCHKILDPIGLGLERYDGIGRYREAYGNGEAIDPAGVLPDGTAFAGPDQLGELVAKDERFNACVANKLFTYALGREIEEPDTNTMLAIQAKWQERGPLTIRNLMKVVVSSNAFRFRRGEAQ